MVEIELHLRAHLTNCIHICPSYDPWNVVHVDDMCREEEYLKDDKGKKRGVSYNKFITEKVKGGKR
jgi:hypothetical protein